MRPPLPPRVVRRVLLAPLMVALAAAAVATSPLTMLLALLASPTPGGGRRPLRVLLGVMAYLVHEAAGILVCFGLWLVSGFGLAIRSRRFHEAHHGLMAWVLGSLYLRTQELIGLRIESTRHDDGPPLEDNTRPLVVLSRHTGLGDSPLVVHAVVELGRRPRIVMKDLLQLDPLLDVLLNRIPTVFIPSKSRSDDDLVAAIGRLAAGMGERDALVLFPEGGNFSERRRRRAIARLEREGHHDEARDAREMRHVLAPRPGGTLAAIESCPTADVVFVAHEGLEDVGSLGALWRNLPMTDPIEVGWWVVPSEDIPRGDNDATTRWLFEHWKEVDSWVAARRPRAAITS